MITEDYNPVKEYLEKDLDDKEVHLWDEELENLIWLAVRLDDYRANIGIRCERIEHNIREKAFSESWLKENKPLVGINFGKGVLQDLFMERKGTLEVPYETVSITKRDRMIVATVIQWLGTNCGMAFLSETVDKFGYQLREKPSEGSKNKL